MKPEFITGVCFLLNSGIIKKMKRTFAILTIFTLIASPFLVLADITIDNPIAATDFKDLINSIIDFLFTVSLFIVPIVIIIGGFFFITAAGNASQIETGKRLVLYAIIGFIIIIMAKGLATAVLDMLGV